MGRFENIIGVGTIAIATLSLPLSLPLAVDNVTSPSPTPTVVSTPTPTAEPSATSTPSLSPTPAPHYTIDSIPSPSEREWSDETVALVYDPSTNVSIVYPHSLPLCDSDDGTAVSDHKLVAACKWDGGDDSFIVIAP